MGTGLGLGVGIRILGALSVVGFWAGAVLLPEFEVFLFLGLLRVFAAGTAVLFACAAAVFAASFEASIGGKRLSGVGVRA